MINERRSSPGKKVARTTLRDPRRSQVKPKKTSSDLLRRLQLNRSPPRPETYW